MRLGKYYGTFLRCENWRAITLLSTASKILTRVFLEKIRNVINSTLSENQAGFRRQRSCVDKICTLKIILDQTFEKQGEIHISFIDFEKDFNTVNRQKMWKILEQDGIRKQFIKILYETYMAQIGNEGQLTIVV